MESIRDEEIIKIMSRLKESNYTYEELKKLWNSDYNSENEENHLDYLYDIACKKNPEKLGMIGFEYEIPKTSINPPKESFYSYITSPKSGDSYNINSKKGKNIIYKYLLKLEGGAVQYDEAYNSFIDKVDYLINQINTNHEHFFQVLKNYIGEKDEYRNLIIIENGNLNLTEDDWNDIINNFLLDELLKLGITIDYQNYLQDDQCNQKIDDLLDNVLEFVRDNQRCILDIFNTEANNGELEEDPLQGLDHPAIPIEDNNGELEEVPLQGLDNLDIPIEDIEPNTVLNSLKRVSKISQKKHLCSSINKYRKQ